MPAKTKYKRIGNPRNSLSEGFRLSMDRRIGSCFRALREKHNADNPDDFISQETLAIHVNIVFGTMNRFEGGKTGLQLKYLIAIATFWGTTVEDVLKDIESPTIEDVFNSPRIKKILSGA